MFRGPGENMFVIPDARNFRRLGSHISSVLWNWNETYVVIRLCTLEVDLDLLPHIHVVPAMHMKRK